MKADKSRVHVPIGKSSKIVKVKDLIINDETLEDFANDLKRQNSELKVVVSELKAMLANRVVLPTDRKVIIEIDGKLSKGIITNAAIDNGENVKISKFENGEITKDKKKVGLMI